LASVYTIFSSGMKTWEKGEAQVARMQNARFAFNIMSREVPTALVTKSGNISCLGDEDKFQFIGLNPEIVEIAYYFEAANNTLRRRVEENPDFEFGSVLSGDPPIARLVGSAQFSYSADGQAWQPTWDGRTNGAEAGRLPRAIKATLSIQDERKRDYEQSFTTMINIPGGHTGEQ